MDQRHLFWARIAGILTFISIGIALLDYLDTTPVPVRIVSDAPREAAPLAQSAAPLSPADPPAETQADAEPPADTSPSVAEPRAAEPQVEDSRSADPPVRRQTVVSPVYSRPRPSRQVAARDPDPLPVARESEIQPVQGASLQFPHVAQ